MQPLDLPRPTVRTAELDGFVAKFPTEAAFVILISSIFGLAVCIVLIISAVSILKQWRQSKQPKSRGKDAHLHDDGEVWSHQYPPGLISVTNYNATGYDMDPPAYTASAAAN